MNFKVVSRLLGIISLLIGATMVFSLPWAFPSLGNRGPAAATPVGFETRGFVSLLISILVCGGLGFVLLRVGRNPGQIFRKEAMAVVGLSWVLATVLGALPFYIAAVKYFPAVRIFSPDKEPQVFRFTNWNWRRQWERTEEVLSKRQYQVIKAMVATKADGLDQEITDQLNQALRQDDLDTRNHVKVILDSLMEQRQWGNVLLQPAPESRADVPEGRYRIRWISMSMIDALFESQSGFSTTGATIIADLENPHLVPHCILFWRSSTHFLGGLGIIVLFVVLLGQGSAGKALMRAEMPGPNKEGSTARMQDTAWLFARIYLGLNLILAGVLWGMGLTLFDALCHAMGTMATGGFSTYNASVGHFRQVPGLNSAAIDYLIVLFMLLAGTNFLLLYSVMMGQPKKLIDDVEWRTYMMTIAAVTILVVSLGLYFRDFPSISDAIRYGLFQVVAIITTTGYGTHDFDAWSHFARGTLLLLMFVGGCAGSTGGGMKVIRHILFVKTLWLEIEQAYHPSVVRPLRFAGTPVENSVRKNILVYFGLIAIIFCVSWLVVIGVEPDATWGEDVHHKLIDGASAVAATLNNIGPGLGTVGPTQNYGHFCSITKLIFVWLMMVGRLEIFPIIVLLSAAFWRDR